LFGDARAMAAAMCCPEMVLRMFGDVDTFGDVPGTSPVPGDDFSPSSSSAFSVLKNARDLK
jgi:hypothetical protein